MDNKKLNQNKYSSGSNLTLQEIADCFNVTRERIRQIEAKALRKVRQRLIQRGLGNDLFVD